ncbi:hypothetical protein FOCC_FOCC007630 [Frankliniella occidentalis]|nr:hypothetical protein FOCC_FOCC007630 [Frankliniella occidentalis]
MEFLEAGASRGGKQGEQSARGRRQHRGRARVPGPGAHPRRGPRRALGAPLDLVQALGEQLAAAAERLHARRRHIGVLLADAQVVAFGQRNAGAVLSGQQRARVAGLHSSGAGARRAGVPHPCQQAHLPAAAEGARPRQAPRCPRQAGVAQDHRRRGHLLQGLPQGLPHGLPQGLRRRARTQADVHGLAAGAGVRLRGRRAARQRAHAARVAQGQGRVLPQQGQEGRPRGEGHRAPGGPAEELRRR